MTPVSGGCILPGSSSGEHCHSPLPAAARNPGPLQRLSSSPGLRLPALSELGNQITKLAEIVSDKPRYKPRREVL